MEGAFLCLEEIMSSKNIKRIVTAAILLGLLIVGIFNIRFTSVSEHDRQQESIRQEILSTEYVTEEVTQISTESVTEGVTEVTTVVTTEAATEVVTQAQPQTQPQTQPATEIEKVTCKIMIECKNLKDNLAALTDENLLKYVPENGVILEEIEIKLPKDSTAYDALNLACKAFNIQMESQFTAIYNTYYVQGIGYLYEKNAGDMSGWIYKVNSKMANVGASSYKIKEGDIISWHYTINGGRDVS